MKGFVSGVDPVAHTFQLRLTPDAATFEVVDASGIALPAGVVPGAYVEVRAAGPATGVPPTIVATAIEVERHLEAAEGGVELEGIVSSDPVAAAGGLELVVDGVTVRTDGATRWDGGAPAEVVRGVKVEVDGALDASGVLHADRVAFRDVVRITAPVGAVGPGMLTILGIEVLLSEFVDYDPNLGGTLAAGHVVEVRGYPTANGKVVALRVDDRSGSDRITLQGIASSKDATDPAQPSFVIMGIHVSTGGATEWSGGTPAASTAQQLFAQVEVGRTILSVRTRSNPDASDLVIAPPDSTLLAKRVELEGND